MVEKPGMTNLDELLKRTFTNDIRPGYITVKDSILPEAWKKYADQIENFVVRDDDVFICSYPKTGSTWTQEMVWCIGNDLDYAGAKEALAERVPRIDMSILVDGSTLVKKFPELNGQQSIRNSIKHVESLPSPRFISCHLPFQLLPRSLRDGETKAKIIYVCRKPKDTCISFYHFSKHYAFRGTFEEFCELFLGDKVLLAPFWSHILGYWNQRNNSSPKILFLTYEEMKSDLASVIQRIANFLDKRALSSEQLIILMNRLSFTHMRNNPAVNQWQKFEFAEKYLMPMTKGEFMRSGQVNQWKTVMSSEIIEKFDEWTVRNLESSDFPPDFYCKNK